MVLDEQLGHAAEHQTSHHAHGGRAGAEALACLDLVVILQRFYTDSLQPVASLLLQLGQFHVSSHQGQKVGHLLDLCQVLVPHPIEVFRKRRKGVVGRPGHRHTALKTVGIVGDDAVERVGRATHRVTVNSFIY